MHTHRCVLIEISIEKGMLNFGLGLLVTALMKETYFSIKVFVFHSEKISACKKDMRSRMNFNPLWVSGRYTALYYSALQCDSKTRGSTQLYIRWMLSTALGLRQVVGLQVWGLKNSKVLSQGWMANAFKRNFHIFLT